MSRESPRFQPAGATVEITAKTVGSRFLLRPGEALNSIILAVIGRALSLFPVDLHAFAFMSNHWHALLTAPDAEAISKFVQHVHSNVARAVNQLHDWSGPVFRKASWAVVAPDAMAERLEYILAQGTKEGLVRCPADWPGAHCARALCGDEVLAGVWRDRSREARLRRKACPGEVETRYQVVLAPLPCWEHVPEVERQRRVREMCARITSKAASERQAVLGVRAVLEMDPHSRPIEGATATRTKLKVKPLSKKLWIHTSDEEARSAFHMSHASFVSAFLEAYDAIRDRRPATVPQHCFPPRPGFTRQRSVYFNDRRSCLRPATYTQPLTSAPLHLRRSS